MTSPIAYLLFDIDVDGKPDLASWRIENGDDQDNGEVADETPDPKNR